eukprot:3080296-Rhodomonas_salina.3
MSGTDIAYAARNNGGPARGLTASACAAVLSAYARAMVCPAALAEEMRRALLRGISRAEERQGITCEFERKRDLVLTDNV